MQCYSGTDHNVCFCLISLGIETHLENSFFVTEGKLCFNRKFPTSSWLCTEVSDHNSHVWRISRDPGLVRSSSLLKTLSLFNYFQNDRIFPKNIVFGFSPVTLIYLSYPYIASSQYSKTQACPNQWRYSVWLKYFTKTQGLSSEVYFCTFASARQFVLNSHQVYCHTLSEGRPANNLNAIKMLGQWGHATIEVNLNILRFNWSVTSW